MPMNLSSLIAWRYLRGVYGNVATMIKVCFIGIFVSCCALTLTMSIMRGFEKAMLEKLQGIHAHLTIRAFGNDLDTATFENFLNTKYPNSLIWAPQESKHLMVQLPNSQDVGDVMILRGVDPEREAKVSKIEKRLVSGRWLNATDTNAVVIGKKQAENLGLHVGEQLNLLFAPEERSGRKITLEKSSARIVGIFQTGIEEYDTSILFCPFGYLVTLFPTAGYTQIGLLLNDGVNQEKTLRELRAELPSLEVYSWQDLYPALLSATALERYVMFIILTLMALIASLSIVALLFMQITQKRSDIAILYAMGCSRKMIARIFLGMGILLTGAAALFGLFTAFCICLLLQRYPILQLPDVYYSTHIPVAVELPMFVLIFMVTIALGFLATWYPVQRTKRINIASVLRHEG
jgi:lipoprotein-releasing system permease protein